MHLSAATLLDDSARSAAALHAAGLRAGDTVALRGAQTRAYVAALVALWRLGAVAVPVARRLPDTDGLADRLARAGARWLVVDAPGDLPAGRPNGVRVVPLPRLDAPPRPLPAWDEVDAAAPAAVVFTSGSTGAARAAQLSHGALRASAAGLNTAFGIGPASAWLLALPLVHVGGLGVLVRMLAAGGAVVLPPPELPLADALALGPTHASLVATQLHRLLAAGHADRLRRTHVLLGGSALAPTLVEAARAAGVHLSTSYGLTEMASTVTATRPHEPSDALSTSGALLPGRTLDIVPTPGGVAEPGVPGEIAVGEIAVGEIAVGGRTRFDGYRTPDGLARPFDAHGRFATGDLGRLDADGRLVVLGRRDRMFISGGENVHPEAVERALLALGGLAEAVVVAVPDAEYGARAFAFVDPDAPPDTPLNAAALLARLAERLPGPMRPVGIARLPESPGLKPSRSALAALARRLHAGA